MTPFFKDSATPFIIAGPCSAESKEQVFQTAEAMKGLPIQLFRAGVWKPRTRPGSFEGKGEEALKWLADLKKQLDLKICIEVAETQHVELALKYHIDVLWLGARTTVNPFQVQNIADALRGVQIPIMVKNPVNPDVDLWQGAIERISKVGINEVAAVHRGFSSYKTTDAYRNIPNWIIPVELKRRCPQLPLFCDPSHISGNASRVALIAQKAMNIGFDGLMIETHIRPNEALTDAAQQLSPAALKELLQNLKQRMPLLPEEHLELEYLRQSADNIDEEILDLLARRMELSRKMGIIKKQNNITIYQVERWIKILESRLEQATNLGLDQKYIAALWQLIHDESIKKQLDLPEQNNS